MYLEWDKLASLVANRFVEVVTEDGRRFLGTLGRSTDLSISVVSLQGATSLLMSDVALIRPIGRGFWNKLDGSIDAGYNYTKSSGVGQFNLNSDTVYQKPASRFRLTASATVTQKDDDSGRDDRGTVEMSYLHYPWQHWFYTGAGRFESNESLGLVLRSQIAGAVGPRLINTSKAQMLVGAGLVVNEEEGVDVPSTQNLEGLLVFRTSYYTYDRPKTNLDINIQYIRASAIPAGTASRPISASNVSCGRISSLPSTSTTHSTVGHQTLRRIRMTSGSYFRSGGAIR